MKAPSARILLFAVVLLFVAAIPLTACKAPLTSGNGEDLPSASDAPSNPSSPDDLDHSIDPSTPSDPTTPGTPSTPSTPSNVCQAPVLVWNPATETLSWEAVEGAAHYEISNDGTVVGTQEETHLTIRKDGTYHIRVRAIAKEGYQSSALSATKTITVGWSGNVK